MSEKILLSPPHLTGLEGTYVQRAIESNWITPLGPEVDAFEKELAEYAGVRGALALSSGTAALHLALRLAGVGAGDEVLCSSLTFVGSVYPILYQGAAPIFVDSEPATWNLSPSALSKALADRHRLGKRPKALIAVNLYGQCADFTPIEEVCRAHNVCLIEDAAESLGATYGTRRSGSFGRFSVYSFNGNKLITTSGGGVLLSNDLEALAKARYWSTQARDPVPHYEHRELGYNYRLSNILAALGRAQFTHVEDRIAARRQVFERYHQALKDIPGVEFMPEAAFGKSNRWLTTLHLTPERGNPAEIVERMRKQDIECRRVWKPMHLQPLFNGTPYYEHEKGFDVGGFLFERGLCLPSGSNLTVAQQDRVIAALKEAFGVV